MANSLTSIHPVYSGVNTCRHNGVTSRLLAIFLARANAYLCMNVTLHLGGTVHNSLVRIVTFFSIDIQTPGTALCISMIRYIDDLVNQCHIYSLNDT